MKVMMIHFLCLVLTLRVGFSSPVDSDYDFGSDFESSMEFVSFPDEGNGKTDSPPPAVDFLNYDFDSSMEFIRFPDEGNDTKDVAPVINQKVEPVHNFEDTIDGALGQER